MLLLAAIRVRKGDGFLLWAREIKLVEKFGLKSHRKRGQTIPEVIDSSRSNEHRTNIVPMQCPCKCQPLRRYSDPP